MAADKSERVAVVPHRDDDAALVLPDPHDPAALAQAQHEQQEQLSRVASNGVELKIWESFRVGRGLIESLSPDAR